MTDGQTNWLLSGLAAPLPVCFHFACCVRFFKTTTKIYGGVLLLRWSIFSQRNKARLNVSLHTFVACGVDIYHSVF